MFLFDNTTLLKCSGITGRYLAANYAALADDFAKVAEATALHADDAYRARRDRDPFVTDRDTRDACFTAYDSQRAFHAAQDTAVRAHDIAASLANDNNSVVKLFKPFKSIEDLALPMASIIAGPICLVLLAFSEVVWFIVTSLNSITSLTISRTNTAQSSSIEAVHHLTRAFKALFAAVVSPLVNTVDFLGSAVLTLAATTQNGDEQGTQDLEENIDTPSLLSA